MASPHPQVPITAHHILLARGLLPATSTYWYGMFSHSQTIILGIVSFMQHETMQMVYIIIIIQIEPS